MAKGFHDVEITINAARKCRQYDEGKKDVAKYAAALRKLRDDRRLLEELGVFRYRPVGRKRNRTVEKELRPECS